MCRRGQLSWFWANWDMFITLTFQTCSWKNGRKGPTPGFFNSLWSNENWRLTFLLKNSIECPSTRTRCRFVLNRPGNLNELVAVEYGGLGDFTVYPLWPRKRYIFQHSLQNYSNYFLTLLEIMMSASVF